MLDPTYIIYYVDGAGNSMKAFTWCRDLASGLARARREAKEFGVEAVDFYGIPV